ncbi:hypothetical protein FACS1894186_7640 [Alphaproteobacteria bacterium]|nr:hypothetical protein FACS1894186_7640 [Alphaproteobacteria bacterium]
MYRFFRGLSAATALAAIAACSGADRVAISPPLYRGHPQIVELSVEFPAKSPWDGKTVPATARCRAKGSKGKTPPLLVSGIPREANVILLEINDISEPYLAEAGGMGVIGFNHDGSDWLTLSPVDGETADLPDFAFVEKDSGDIVQRPRGYLPPCGSGHSYEARVWAVKRTDKDPSRDVILGIGEINLGRD